MPRILEQGHFKTGVSFPFYYTTMSSMRYNTHMTNIRYVHKYEVIIGEAPACENFSPSVSYKR